VLQTIPYVSGQVGGVVTKAAQLFLKAAPIYLIVTDWFRSTRPLVEIRKS
jgi:hypothetical protein